MAGKDGAETPITSGVYFEGMIGGYH